MTFLSNDEDNMTRMLESLDTRYEHRLDEGILAREDLKRVEIEGGRVFWYQGLFRKKKTDVQEWSSLVGDGDDLEAAFQAGKGQAQ